LNPHSLTRAGGCVNFLFMRRNFNATKITPIHSLQSAILWYSSQCEQCATGFKTSVNFLFGQKGKKKKPCERRIVFTDTRPYVKKRQNVWSIWTLFHLRNNFVEAEIFAGIRQQTHQSVSSFQNTTLTSIWFKQII
jgi:hypothetical protein